jgi:ParB family chromosome partitioning protein
MSLKNKAAKLDFSNLPGLAPDAEVPTRPKTAPGAMMAFANEARSDLLRENEALQARARQAEAVQGRLDEALNELRQWDGAKATRLIDPALIRPSRWANRHELNFSSPLFEKLKAEVADAGGNVQPIKVRPVAEPAGSFEVVYGHRRLEACRQLGLPVLCLVDNIEDRALFVEMERENRGRKDLSAWEQGMMYRRALDAGLFPSLRQLASSIGMQPGNVSTALQIAALPDGVVQAFASPLDLQFRFVAPLKAALERDEAGVLERARALAAQTPRPGAREVLARLTGQDENANLSRQTRYTLGGKVVGSCDKDAQGNVTLRFKAGALTSDKEKRLLELLAKFFD